MYASDLLLSLDSQSFKCVRGGPTTVVERLLSAVLVLLASSLVSRPGGRVTQYKNPDTR